MRGGFSSLSLSPLKYTPEVESVPRCEPSTYQIFGSSLNYYVAIDCPYNILYIIVFHHRNNHDDDDDDSISSNSNDIII